MKSFRQTFLSRLDDTVRWTGIPARVAEDMSDAPPADREHRPLRWIPIGPIAFSCALFILCLAWPPVLDRVSPAAVISVIVAFMTGIVGMVPGIHSNGPLGKPSNEDDERVAALRKGSFLFCFGLLAVLNGLGQPLLMILSHWQNWPLGRSAIVVISALILNVSLFGCLPTLYASWNLRELPKD